LEENDFIFFKFKNKSLIEKISEEYTVKDVLKVKTQPNQSKIAISTENKVFSAGPKAYIHKRIAISYYWICLSHLSAHTLSSHI